MSGGVIDIYGICMRYLCRMDGRLSFQISMFVYSREREVLGARGGENIYVRLDWQCLTWLHFRVPIMNV